MNLREQLTGQTLIQNAPILQQAQATTGEVYHTLRGITVAPILTNGYSTELMGTSPVGYSIPNPTFIQGIPKNTDIMETPKVRYSDAPIQKGCGS